MIIKISKLNTTVYKNVSLKTELGKCLLDERHNKGHVGDKKSIRIAINLSGLENEYLNIKYFE